ncbi:nuclease A inhibitor family protein [Pontibacter sp. XAAS-A31]|nr:nuclease A inhibitor family protein [Pontibacter harenae]
MSETDAQLEVVRFPAPKSSEPTTAELAGWAGKPPGERIEPQELQYFFRNMTKEHSDMGEAEKRERARFVELQDYLVQNLRQVKVYQVGRRRVTALILGFTPTGELAGFKTNLVQT